MSVEQINMSQAMAVVPFMKMFLSMILICIGLWYGTKLGCILLDKIIRLFDSGRVKRKKHCECSK